MQRSLRSHRFCGVTRAAAACRAASVDSPAGARGSGARSGLRALDDTEDFPLLGSTSGKCSAPRPLSANFSSRLLHS
jgi:hypothetical protein